MTLKTNDDYRAALRWMVAESGLSPTVFATQVFGRSHSALTRKPTPTNPKRGWLYGGKIPQRIREWIDARMPDLARLREADAYSDPEPIPPPGTPPRRRYATRRGHSRQLVNPRPTTPEESTR